MAKKTWINGEEVTAEKLNRLESDVDNKLSKTGGLMEGIITTPNNNVGIIVGDDVKLCDRNIANTLILEGNQNPDRAGIKLGSNGGSIYTNGNSTINVSNNINVLGAIHENGQRVYSPNNPPPGNSNSNGATLLWSGITRINENQEVVVLSTTYIPHTARNYIILVGEYDAIGIMHYIHCTSFPWNKSNIDGIISETNYHSTITYELSVSETNRYGIGFTFNGLPDWKTPYPVGWYLFGVWLQNEMEIR